MESVRLVAPDVRSSCTRSPCPRSARTTHWSASTPRAFAIRTYFTARAFIPSPTCGACDLCAGGHELFCAIGQMLGKHRPGGFVEYLVMPAGSLYVLPTEISFAHGAVRDEREKFSGTTRAIVSVTP